MRKFFRHLVKAPIQKWWVFLIFWLGFFVFFHALAFFYHQFLVYKYDRLYEEATQSGTLVEMPKLFQRAQSVARDRSIFTRPDKLARETGILQSGIRSLIEQYRNDLYRMHDTIAQHISYLRIVGDVTQEMIFPDRERILRMADRIESELDSGRFSRPADLERLLQISQSEVDQTRTRYDEAQKKLVLEDILNFKHEMRFLDSLYRVTPELEDEDRVISDFWKEFEYEFSESNLTELNADELRATYATLRMETEEYGERWHKYRLEAKKDRQDQVAIEAKKWTEKIPPSPPFPDVFSQISISLKQQMMYAYEDGELVLSTPITSGRRNYETIRGTFKVYTKQRNKLMKSPFPDEEYELWVDYWLGFYGAYGIHDACNSRDCWRTKFGWASYTYNGSHGCVNTPYNAVKFIYNWAQIGTTVHVE